MSQVYNVGQNEGKTEAVVPPAAAAEENAKPAPTARFKNRSRMEIVSNVLQIARSGALKTHLMYKANLSYMVVSQYLDFLTKSELIKETFDDQGMVKLYQTTPKGLKYLQVYESLQSIAGIDAQRGMHAQNTELFG